MAKLPRGTAVYQFPDSTWGGLMAWSYTQMKPFIHTDHLVWSAQHTFGQQSWHWGYEMAHLEFGRMIDRLKAKGFGAVHVNTEIYEEDRKHPNLAYKLPTKEFLAALAGISPLPPMISADGVHQIFALPGYQTAKLIRNCERYDPGTVLDVKEGKRTGRYLDAGWNPPTPHGTWMVNNHFDHSIIRLCLPARPTRDLELEAEMAAHLTAALPRVDMRIEVNGVMVASEDFVFGKTGLVKMKARVPVIAITRPPTVVVMFRWSRPGLRAPTGDSMIGARLDTLVLRPVD